MNEIRIVSPGKTCKYPYPMCKKRIVSPGKTCGYPYPLGKNVRFKAIIFFSTVLHGFRRSGKKK